MKRRAMTSGRRPRRVRRNPPRSLLVKRFGSARGHLVSRQLLAVEYFHAESSGSRPYRHDFDSRDVQLWALADGSLLLRGGHGQRLWDDYVVGDDA